MIDFERLKLLELITQKKRIKIINLLYNEPNLYASLIGQRLNVNRKMVKQHLDLMYDYSLVETTDRNYRLTDECKKLFERLVNTIGENNK